MDNTEKLIMLKTFLGISDTSEDTTLEAYLLASSQEILQYKYSYASKIPEVVDTEDEIVQILAVVAGFNLIGMENQTSHTENGIDRKFKYSDMVEYIRNNITPYVKIGG